MQKTVYACDECNIETSDPKDWMRVVEINSGVSVTRWDSDLMPAKNRKVQHACGQACVIQAVQKWMNPSEKKPISNSETQIESPLPPEREQEFHRRMVDVDTVRSHDISCAKILYGQKCDCGASY